ncbi:mechanosensitive ion channel family protein [Micromonospora sp. NBC_01796]|uniref:mechanosensitive ion channel family protein n=1 Tax=Micromonospora sp. NBC_01796 TaxID=2975987 RepID=UPI002DDB8881|nr:hypothetical protein [Micromonospora sp. NBC_01796]WSA86253.1 hypothetical protein OIE47_01135 [Micromonospora sp. NBC_01796]
MPGILAVRQVEVATELTEIWNSVLLFVPRLIGCAGILMLGWLLARFVLRMAIRLLDRFGFDQVVQRGGLGRLVARTRYRPATVLARVAYYLLLLFTLRLAFAIWGPNPAHDLVEAVVGWLPQAFVALVVVAVSVVIANAVHDLITDALGRVSYGRLLADVVSLLVIALGVIAAFVQTGVARVVTVPVLVTLLATVAGILIVGVGGGLVGPMRVRWEEWLRRVADEARQRRARAEAYPRGTDPGSPYAEPAVTARASVPPLTGATSAVPTLADPTLADVPTSPAPDGLLGSYEPASSGPTGGYDPATDGLNAYEPLSDGISTPYEPLPDTLTAGYEPLPDGISTAYEPLPDGISTAYEPLPDVLAAGYEVAPEGLASVAPSTDGVPAYQPNPLTEGAASHPSDLLTPAPERPTGGADEASR